MRIAWPIVLVLVITAAEVRASDQLDIDGYFKSFFVAYELPRVTANGYSIKPPTLGSVANRLRLNARLRIRRNISFTRSIQR